jgi:hypothetical protein
MAVSISGAGGSNVNLADIHHALASGGTPSSDNSSGLAFGGHSMVPGSAPEAGAVGNAPVSFAGQVSGPSHGGVVTTQDVQEGGVQLQLNDGSTINVLGALHVDPTLFNK